MPSFLCFSRFLHIESTRTSEGKNKNQTQRLLESSWLSFPSIPSVQFSLIYLAGENSRMAEGISLLSVVLRKVSASIPDGTGTDLFSPGPLCPWLSFPSVAGGVSLPALTCSMSSCREPRPLQLSQENLPWGVGELGRWRWVFREGCRWKFSVLTFLDLIILFHCILLPEMNFYKYGSQHHSNVTFLWVITFTGILCRAVTWASMWLCLVMESLFADENTEVVLWRGFTHSVRESVQCMWDEAVAHVSCALYLCPDMAKNHIIFPGIFSTKLI